MRWAARRTRPTRWPPRARPRPAWAATPYTARIELLRRAAALIEERVFELAAAVALEVGKNRMEAIGEVQETADLITWYCDQMADNAGFDRRLPDDPLTGWRSRNRTVLKPHGVWAVIAPFNFPFALAGGPIGAALVAGNTVVFKTASDTAWSGRLLMDVFLAAGLPAGVVNLVSGAGSEVGDALMRTPALAGATFTGSHAVGMGLLRHFAAGPRPRPLIAEMGGKNAAIVTRHADLDRAATGIVRSAFGLQGQKCSACSRVYVAREVAAALRERLVERTAGHRRGRPHRGRELDGPGDQRGRASSATAAPSSSSKPRARSTAAARCWAQARWRVATSSRRRWPASRTGTACGATSSSCRLVLVGEVASLDEAIERANDSDYGLTAGFYGAPDEIGTFLDRIEAGVTYVNRPQGATTGAWPGYQPFGGWKGSGNTGKAIGSFWYLPQYLREQSQTVVD